MATPESPQGHFPFPFFPRARVYSAKFLCGEYREMEGEGPVKPGNYATNINVHNPNRHPVSILKKVILLFNASEPGASFPERPTGPRESIRRARLEPDYGIEIDCRVIREELLGGPPAPTFIKGWVVIEAGIHPLDVVAVYTARTGRADAGSLSITTDRVVGTEVNLF
jgi:hypothetical protein